MHAAGEGERFCRQVSGRWFRGAKPVASGNNNRNSADDAQRQQQTGVVSCRMLITVPVTSRFVQGRGFVGSCRGSPGKILTPGLLQL